MINLVKVILNLILMDEIIIFYELVILKLKYSFFCLLYSVLGCFPYIKYHCTQRLKTTDDLSYENRLYRIFKIFNLGIPTLMYGLAAIFLIRHYEIVNTNQYGFIKIYFLIKENPDSSF
jgi:hypothetical protein